MSLDPFNLAIGGTIAVQVVMAGLCLYVRRWQLATFRFEREVMLLTTLALGPLGMLLTEAIPLDPPYLAPLTTYLKLGMLLLLLQVLFWTAFVRLVRRHRNEQAVLLAAETEVAT